MNINKILIIQVRYNYSEFMVVGTEKQRRLLGLRVDAQVNGVDITTNIKTDKELSNKEIREEIIKKLEINNQCQNTTINIEYAGVDSLKESIEKVVSEMTDKMSMALQNLDR